LIPPERGGSGEPVDTTTGTGASDSPPASRLFTIEGRAAPALFLVAWLGTLVGAVMLFVALQAGAGLGKLVLFLGGLALLSIGLIAAAGSQGLERRARGSDAYQGPSPILVFLATLPISVLILALLGIPLDLAGVDPTEPIVAVVALAVNVVIYASLIRLLVVDTGALSWSQMGLRRPSRAAVGELVAGAAWAIPIIFITAPIAAILANVLGVTPDPVLPPSPDSVGSWLNGFSGAVLAPIGEELFFRAFATTAWVVALGRNQGIIRGGLVFALAHVLMVQATEPGEGLALALIGFVSRVPVGLALSWLFVRRGSIWAPLGLHAAYNGVIILIAETATRTGAA
jgi:membrane protease YdiL (CAAX protease family)